MNASSRSSWEMWCPSWWIHSGEHPRLAVGDDLDVAVGFVVDTDWMTVHRGEPMARLVARGEYDVTGLVGLIPNMWTIDIGGLRLVSDGWEASSLERAKALRAGDRIRGQFELWVDPTVDEGSTTLQVAGIELRTGPRFSESHPGAGRRDTDHVSWTSVDSVDVASIDRLEPDVLLTCTTTSQVV